MVPRPAGRHFNYVYFDLRCHCHLEKLISVFTMNNFHLFSSVVVALSHHLSLSLQLDFWKGFCKARLNSGRYQFASAGSSIGSFHFPPQFYACHDNSVVSGYPNRRDRCKLGLVGRKTVADRTV